MLITNTTKLWTGGLMLFVELRSLHPLRRIGGAASHCQFQRDADTVKRLMASMV